LSNHSLKELLEGGQKIQEELIRMRRDLHRFPELSFQESETAAKVAERMRALGLEVRMQVGGHGVVAELRGKQPGPTIALRADMDALPIQEETGLPFASERPGIMHACGHDAHTSILTGAAMLLAPFADRLKGNVRFLFQSAEEINAGAKAMIEAGALEDVREIYGLHNLPTLPAGMVATRRGPLMGSVDRIEITLEGKGGHGAIPDQSIDPIVAASSVIMSLQTAVSREISPFEPVVVTIGSIHAGDANNVIPQRAHMTGTVRTFSPKAHGQIPGIIERIVQKTAESYRCRADLKYIRQVPVLVGHDRCVSHVEQTAAALIGEDKCVEAAPTMAGEDFSVYLEHAEGCFFWLGSGPPEGAEQNYGLHHPEFTVNEDCLSLGASILAAAALSRLIEF
jgi:amidohydrolase